MRRIALFVVMGSTLAYAGAVSLGVAGCSSDPAPAAKDAGSKNKVPSSSGDDDDSTSSSSSSSSSSGSSSSGGNKDGGADASTSSGGLGSNPKKITCGATACDTDGAGTGACCWAGGDQAKATCAPAGGECDPNNEFNIACDEKADCTAGVCCWGDGQTQCAADCTDANVNRPDGQPDIQVCKTDAECLPAGTKCAVKTCTIDPNGINVKAKMSVCGTPTGCN